MSKVFVVMAIAFAVILAAVMGLRMSDDAISVVVGVFCGAAAGIPMSLLLLAVLGRRQNPNEEMYSRGMGAHSRTYPPVVVIQGGLPLSGSFVSPHYPGPTPLVQAAPRRFRVVGEGED